MIGGDSGGTTLLSAMITAEHVTALRHSVTATAAAAGLTGEELEDFVLAVNELTTNAIRHGGGRGQLLLCRQGDWLICQVTDQGRGMTDHVPFPSLPDPTRPGHRGLWLAHHLAAELTLTSGPNGLTATVRMPLPSKEAQ